MRSTQLHISLLAFLLFVVTACHVNRDDAVVNVYGYELHNDDLSRLITDDMTSEDSIVIVQNYINQWVSQMVVLNEAEKVIDDDFDDEVEAYRNSLIVKAYEDYYVKSNIDSIVTDEEIKAYYNTHVSDFTLRSSIVKAAFVRLSRNSRSSSRIRAIFALPTIGEINLSEVQRLAATDAEDYFFGQNMWIPFNQVQSLMSLPASNESLFLQQNYFYETSDENSFYFVHFFDARTVGQLSPLETEYDKVRSIILNRRRSVLLATLYQDLLKKGEVSKKIVFGDNGETD